MGIIPTTRLGWIDDEGKEINRIGNLIYEMHSTPAYKTEGLYEELKIAIKEHEDKTFPVKN